MGRRRFRHIAAVMKRALIVPLPRAFWYPAARWANYLSETTNGSFKFIFDDPWRRLAVDQLGVAADHCLARGVRLGHVRLAAAPGRVRLRVISSGQSQRLVGLRAPRLDTDLVGLVNR